MQLLSERRHQGVYSSLPSVIFHKNNQINANMYYNVQRALCVLLLLFVLAGPLPSPLDRCHYQIVIIWFELNQYFVAIVAAALYIRDNIVQCGREVFALFSIISNENRTYPNNNQL